MSGPHAYDQIPELVERSRQRVANFVTDFDERLNSEQYVAGTEFSVVDITTLMTVDFATKAFKMTIPAEFTTFQRWYDEVST